MNKFKLNKIDGYIVDILNKESKFSREENNKKPINVFYMKNRGGKTLIFSLLYELLSGENDFSINKAYPNILLDVSASNGDEDFLYTLNGKSIKIKLGNKLVSRDDYIENIASQLSIFENLISNYGNKPSRKNTLKSMFRYIFISDHDIYKKNRGENIEQKLVNFKYDGYLKKALLSYFLGLDLTNEEFQILGEFYYRENYLNDHLKEYTEYNEQFSLFNDEDATEIFYQYSKTRKQLGDITVAIEHIENQIKISKKLGTFEKYDEDIMFLNSQLRILRKTKNKLKQDIGILNKKINKIKSLGMESNDLGKESIKEIIRSYERFCVEIKDFKVKSEVNINKVENILSKCGIFIKEHLGKLGYHNIDVNLLEQTFKSGAPRSEGEMATIRILGTILINIFSNMNKGRLINICLFDTAFESIDENNGHELFKKIELLYENEELKKYIPQIFCFITGTEDRFKIKDLSKYNVMMNSFIEFNDM